MTDSLYSVLGILNEVIDFILLTVFLLAVFFVIVAYKNRKILRIRSWIVIVGSILTIGTIIYGSTVEQLRIVTTEYTIDINDYSGDPQRFILVSDLHVGQFLNTIKLPLVVNKINSIDNSEYVFILGDVVNDSSSGLSDLDYLSKINKTGIFIYGNHDYENAEPPVRLVDGLEEKVTELGFTILDNKIITIGEDESEITITGIKDLWSQEEDLTIMNNISEDEPLILLSHNPDVLLDLDEEGYSDVVDLVLSGHTHGGEIRLPFIGPVGPMPIKLPREYSKGYNEYEGIPVFVTSGVGSTGIRMRLFNPPEIVVLTIE